MGGLIIRHGTWRMTDVAAQSTLRERYRATDRPGGRRLSVDPTANLTHARARRAAGGDSLVFPETIRLMERNAPANRDPRVAKKLHDNTCSRQREVLSLFACGHSTAEIAEQLFISEPTVKAHIQHMGRSSTSWS